MVKPLFIFHVSVDSRLRATTEGDQPKVQPFGTVFEYKGKMYIATNNPKDAAKKCKKIPKLKIRGVTEIDSGFVSQVKILITLK